MLRRPHKVVLACLVLLLFAVALYSGRQIQQLPGRAVLPAAGSTVLPPPTATSIAPSGGHTPPPLTTAPTNRAMQPPMERPTAPIEHSVADQAPTATATSSGEAGVLPLVIQRVETTRPYVALTVDDFYTGDYRRRTAIRMLTATNAAHAT